MKEAVDISYTKFNGIDNSPYNFVKPKEDQLYIGWTEPGEWTKYTVNVKSSGSYKLGIMYTSSSKKCKISLSINDKDVTGPMLLNSTFVEEDSIGWRQWHHWNKIDSLSTISFEKGIQTITLHTVEMGQANYDFLEFKLIN